MWGDRLNFGIFMAPKFDKTPMNLFPRGAATFTSLKIRFSTPK